jgi:hypothetical protein
LPRSTAAHSTNKLNSVPFGYDVVTRVLEAATTLGWVTVTPGFDGGDEGQGQVTRIQAAGDLLIHFHSLGVQWQELASPPPEELIVLATEEKGKGRRLVLRDEDERVPAMQDNLDRINKYLLTQCIHLNCPDSILLDPVDGVVSQGDVKATPGRYNKKDRPRSLNFQDVTMRRIFAHNSLDKGGALLRWLVATHPQRIPRAHLDQGPPHRRMRLLGDRIGLPVCPRGSDDG